MNYLFTLLNIIVLTLAIFFGVKGLYKTVDPKLWLKPDNFRLCSVKTETGNFKSEPEISGASFTNVTARNLFKAAVKGSEKPADTQTSGSVDEADIAGLEKTTLDLRLWGTVVGSDSNAFAVIEEKKKRKQSLYHKGDNVQGAVIKTILRHKVILSFNGQDQILEMDLTGKTDGAKVKRRFGPPMPGATSTVVIDRSTIDASTSDLNSLMKQVKIRPHFAGGKPDGLLLYGIQKSSIFQEMGLNNGDIIMGVGGKEIRSVDDALALYSSLKNATDVNLQIKRRGKIKEINYHVQ